MLKRSDVKEMLQRARPSDTTSAPRVIQSTLFGILFTAALVLTVIASLQTMSDDGIKNASPILKFNLGLILALTVYLAVRVWLSLFTKQARRATPLLHRRFVSIFCLAALVPAVLVGAFSTSLISKNISDVFGEDVQDTLDSSYSFLNEYLAQELVSLTPQITAAKRYLQTNSRFFDNRISFSAYLQRFSRSLDIDALYVLDRSGRIFARVEGPNTPPLQIPDGFVFDFIAEQDRPAYQTRDEIDYLVGLVRLEGYEDTFLMAGRQLSANTNILSSITRIDEARNSITRYKDNRDEFEDVFLLLFFETALLILIAAVWLGLILANRIIEPIDSLVNAAEKVRGGDLSARVAVKGNWGEISDLGSAFNRMTRQLSSQREDLVQSHDVSERRRKFSEAVLSGVRAGVIGLTEEGRITLINRSAEILTGKTALDITGHPLERVLPEFSPAFKKARESIRGSAEDQIDLETEAGILNFDIRVSGYEDGEADTGWVITFDDMTRLVAAQRQSAWREVARRIAHEIKNPLTPILLSAERLRRKYRGAITKDVDVFENCTDTIIRQVGNLEQMVDEFSNYARMPEPVFELHSANEFITSILFAQRVAFPDVQFVWRKETEHDDIKILADERLLGQALTNIYKNASEAITRRLDNSGADVQDGLIVTVFDKADENLIVTITDNGPGWPVPDTDRLLEPYVTTRKSGTGLGLAIVKRVIEDHGGEISLSNRSDNLPGAQVTLTFPILDSLGTSSKTKSRIPLTQVN